MKTKTKKRATRRSPGAPRENRSIPHTKKTRALRDQPPGAPSDGLPPTPVELLAFATAIHGSGPLPKNHKALKKLFSQAIALWQESQDQIKIYSERLRRLQEEMVPVLTKDDPWSKQFKSLGDFFRYVTGLTNSGDAKRELRKWLDSKKLKDPEKKIEHFKRTFVDAVGCRPFLEGMKRMLLDWRRRNSGTAGANNAALRECYRFVRKVTELNDEEMVKALIVEWKKHEATTGHQTGEGAALLERLRERFPPWWKEKQAGNANGNDPQNPAGGRPPKKSRKKF